jgi:hypothetical protein
MAGGNCRQVVATQLSKHPVASLAPGRAHTVLIQIGKCGPGGGFTLAAIVRVDGKVAVWGGLSLDQVPDFKKEITEQALQRWGTKVVIQEDLDVTGNIVVPCPPPR